MNDLIEMGLGTFIDSTVDRELTKDQVYLKDLSDLEQIKQKLDILLVDEHQKQLFEDYVSCVFSANVRACHIDYLTAFKNIMMSR